MKGITIDFIKELGFEVFLERPNSGSYIFEKRFNFQYGFSCYTSLFLEWNGSFFSMYIPKDFKFLNEKHWVFQEFKCENTDELLFLLTKSSVNALELPKQAMVYVTQNKSETY